MRSSHFRSLHWLKLSFAVTWMELEDSKQHCQKQNSASLRLSTVGRRWVGPITVRYMHMEYHHLHIQLMPHPFFLHVHVCFLCMFVYTWVGACWGGQYARVCGSQSLTLGVSLEWYPCHLLRQGLSLTPGHMDLAFLDSQLGESAVLCLWIVGMTDELPYPLSLSRGSGNPNSSSTVTQVLFTQPVLQPRN